MLGRLFKFIVLTGLTALIGRLLLNPAQRRDVHRLFKTLAWALLVSAAIMVVLSLPRFATL